MSEGHGGRKGQPPCLRVEPALSCSRTQRRPPSPLLCRFPSPSTRVRCPHELLRPAQNFSWALLLGKPGPDGRQLAAVSTAAPAECPAPWGRGVQCEGPQTGEWRAWQGGRSALAGPSNTQEPLPGRQSGCRGVGGLDEGREVRRERGQVRELAQHGQAVAGGAGQRSGRRRGCCPVARGPPREAGEQGLAGAVGLFPHGCALGQTLLLVDSTLLGLSRMGHILGDHNRKLHTLFISCAGPPGTAGTRAGRSKVLNVILSGTGKPAADPSVGSEWGGRVC